MRLHFIVAALLANNFPAASARSLPKSAAAAAGQFPDPNIDPFYHAPLDIASFPPGQVLRNRPVSTTITGRSVKSYQVFYRTTDQQGDAVGTVATIWEPALPQSPPKIFSYQFAEDALNRDCAPSWAWANSSSVVEASAQGEGSIIVPWALSQGYYVVNADDEGPNSAWLVGRMEGHAVLDGIRATINYLRLSKKQTEAVLYGYSGGAHESVWAASLAASYAPDVNIVGAAFGGTPVDLRPAYYLLNGAPGALLAGGAIIGLANGFPRLNATVNSQLTPNGTKIVELLRSNNYCITTHQQDFADFNFSTIFKGNFLNNPEVDSVLAQESLLMNVSTMSVPVPKFPRLEWHGMNDTTVPYLPEKEYVEQQCAKGADIRFLSLPGLDHGEAYLAGLPGALLFIEQAFSKELPKAQCGANVTVPAIGSLESIEVLGVDNNVLLEALFVAEGA